MRAYKFFSWKVQVINKEKTIGSMENVDREEPLIAGLFSEKETKTSADKISKDA